MYWKNQKKTEYFRFTVLREEEEWIESDYTTFNGQMQEKNQGSCYNLGNIQKIHELLQSHP